MRKMQAAIIAAVIGLLWLLPAATAANAHGFGFRGHSLRFARHWYWPRYYGAFGRWALYDGWIDVPPYGPDFFTGYPSPPMVVFLPGPLRVPSCRRSEETMTVAAEEGGTRQITIKRCYP